jgi:hypothetical protein
MVGRLELRDDFKEEAEWRREKAKQYPHDERYLAAAAIFDRLAATVDDIPQYVFLAFSEPGPDVIDGLLDVERWTEMLREVGFGSSPEIAEDFVRPLLRIEICDADNQLTPLILAPSDYVRWL